MLRYSHLIVGLAIYSSAIGLALAAYAAEPAAVSKPEPTNNRRGDEEFHREVAQPALQGDLDTVKSQLAASPELVNKILPFEEMGNQGDRTLLHYAVAGKQLQVVEFLVSKGADVNLQTEHVPTPLHLAAKNGDVAIAKFLIDHGAKVNAKAQGHGPTPLQEALINANRAAAELLVKSGAKSNFFTDVASGNLEAVKKQLEGDPTIAVRPDGWGRPPLAYAAGAGQEKVAAALFAAGAKDRPARERQVGLSLGPPPDHPDRSAIWWAVKHKNVAVVRLLCRAGSDPNLLDEAIHKNSLPLVHELLAQKADPDREDIRGYRPLHNAAVLNKPDIIRLLLDAGADPEAWTGADRSPCGFSGGESFTPLQLAAEQGSAKSIAELLKSGANVKVVDRSRRTPLHFVVNSNIPPSKLVDAVRELHEAGAPVNAKDENGLTPLDLALIKARTADKPDSSVVDYLRAAGAKTGS